MGGVCTRKVWAWAVKVLLVILMAAISANPRIRIVPFKSGPSITLSGFKSLDRHREFVVYGEHSKCLIHRKGEQYTVTVEHGLAEDCVLTEARMFELQMRRSLEAQNRLQHEIDELRRYLPRWSDPPSVLRQ